MALHLKPIWLILLFLTACTNALPISQPSIAETTAAPSVSPADGRSLASPTAPAESEAYPSPTPPEAQTATPTAPTVPAPGLCSPLGGMALADLPNLVSNPYHPPRPGFDDPHAGVDLAVMLPGSRVAVSGSPVMAAFAGRVIMTTANRFPFGNAIIIETPLDAPAVQALSGAAIPTPAPTLPPLSALTCPPYPPLAGANHAERSLYILYAHLRDAPAWQQGDPVTCGQEIGAVGDSGNALNPHLHFETRAGPAGMRLGPMAHYDASASSEEMASYCQWSVSGLFQLIDPLQVLGALPGQAQ